MRRICYENGLSLVLFRLFVLCTVGQSVAGHRPVPPLIGEKGPYKVPPC